MVSLLSAITTRANVYVSVGAHYQTADERTRQRIREWVEKQGHGAQRRLARAVPGKYGKPHTDQWVSDILNREGGVRLRDLDAIAEVMGIPPGDLIRRDDDLYVEVSPSEFRLLHQLRALPEVLRRHWFSFVDHALRIEASLDSKTVQRPGFRQPRRAVR